MKKGVLRSDRRIIEPGGNRMGRRYLATIILEHVTHCALQDARTAPAIRIESRGVVTQIVAASSSFNSNHAHCFITQKQVKQSDGIRSAADAGNQASGFPVQESACASHAQSRSGTRAPSMGMGVAPTRCQANNRCLKRSSP